MGLLSLANKHSRQSVEQACEIAQSHGAYHLRSLRQLIEHPSIGGSGTVQQNFQFIQEHPIIRDLGDYQQFVREAITQQPLPAEGKASALESNR
jgi:hypothetical protein